MFCTPPKEPKIFSWSIVFAWAVVIYATIPIARRLQEIVDRSFGRESFLLIVLAFLAIALIGGLSVLIRSRGRISAANLFWLLLICAVFVVWTWHLRDAPEEALHFVQYGVLGLLLYRALLHHCRDFGIYLVAALLGSIIGTIDEIIQWIVPGRYFDFRDIWLNTGAGVLTQAGIALGISPPLISGRPTHKGKSLICRLTAVQLLILGICFSNTPARVAWYAPRIPFLQFLEHNPNVMAEYGYRFHAPAIGIFYSRFSAEQLPTEDLRRGKNVASLIDAWPEAERYGEFLARYGPTVDALAHEVRVRVFRRDSYLVRASGFKPGDRNYHNYLTVAYREHLILERYYPETYNNSTYKLDPEHAKYLQQAQLQDYNYTSPVGGHLITSVTERQIWIVILLVLIGLRWLKVMK